MTVLFCKLLEGLADNECLRFDSRYIPLESFLNELTRNRSIQPHEYNLQIVDCEERNSCY